MPRRRSRAMPARCARRAASEAQSAESIARSHALHEATWDNMGDLTTLPNQLDLKTRLCRAIIETPKGCRNKFDYDPESNLFELGGLLPEGMMFPFDFGFIPSTLGEDGDPLDIMVLMDAPAHVGCLIDVRIIGIIEAKQIQDGKKETNDRLLGVAVHSYDHEYLKTIDDVSETLLAQVEAFFVSYNKQRDKKFKITGTGGPKKAIRFVKSGSQAHRSKVKKLARPRQ
jgi:inorganic pyrophosphatase